MTKLVQILAAVSDQAKNFAVIYLIDISEVPDFNTMYELYDPCTVMFFFRNKVRWRALLALHAALCRLTSTRGLFCLQLTQGHLS